MKTVVPKVNRLKIYVPLKEVALGETKWEQILL